MLKNNLTARTSAPLKRATKALAAAAVFAAGALASQAHGQVLNLEYSVNLDDSLADPSSNFHPQGLGYDTATNELLYMQQSSSTIFRTDLNGNVTGSRAIGYNHTTSVAGDGSAYYFSDYTTNSSGLDLFAIDKTPPNAAVSISAETAAYGGYPIDVRGGNVYRTENSNDYDWGNLTQLRVSSLGSVDSFSTVTLAAPSGIGDIAVDAVCNAVWVLDYSVSASLRQFDLTTGSELNSFALGLEGETAGITYANDMLYYYDWNSGSGSTLTAYSMSGFTCNAGPDEVSSVPVPTMPLYGLVMSMLGLLWVGVRRLRTTSERD